MDHAEVEECDSIKTRKRGATTLKGFTRETHNPTGPDLELLHHPLKDNPESPSAESPERPSFGTPPGPDSAALGAAL